MEAALNGRLVTPRKPRLKIVVSIGAMRIVIPLETMSQAPEMRLRARNKGNGQFARERYDASRHEPELPFAAQ
jgi:hypothetical protein